MDVNDLRNAVTAVSFVLFIGIVIWSLLRRNAAAFEEAALLPFVDGEPAVSKEPTP